MKKSLEEAKEGEEEKISMKSNVKLREVEREPNTYLQLLAFR